MSPGASPWRWVRHSRRPVGPWRRAAGVAFVLLVGLAILAWHHVTDEERLRKYAQRWLEEFAGGEALVERVRLDLSSGLHLVGVKLLVPAGSGFDPGDDTSEGRTVFESSTLFLRLRPLSLVTGDLVVPEIVAVNPQLTLVQRSSDGLGNWEAMLAGRKTRPAGAAGGVTRLPEIRLRNVQVRQYRIDERGRTGGLSQVFYADARPREDRPGVYDLSVTKLLTGEAGQAIGESSRLTIDMSTLAVSGSLPSLSLEELLFAAPLELRRWLDMLHLRGYVRADTFQFDPRRGGEALLKLRDAGLSVPLDIRERTLPEGQRYVRFSGVSGTIRFDGRTADVELDGRFRESPVYLSGRLTMPESGLPSLEAMAFELEVRAERVPLPRFDPDRDPAERRFVNRWAKLREFVEDFDGDGPVGLSLKLRKAPGAGAGIELVEGVMTAQGCSGAYLAFPYRVEELTGEVVFRPDRSILIRELTGRQGHARVTVNGVVGGWRPGTPVELSIRGERVPLNERLLTCMKPEDQRLCRQYLGSALMDLNVRMSREEARPGAEWPRWHTVIDVTFREGTVHLPGFPDLLSGLTGRARISGPDLEFDGLRARRGEAWASLDGRARLAGERVAMLDLDLLAEDMQLQDALARAFVPAAARADFERLEARGRARLQARLRKPRIDAPVSFETDALLEDLRLLIPGTCLTLENARVTARLSDDRLTVESVEGLLNGVSPFRARAEVVSAGSEGSLEAAVTSDRLVLDAALREGLPEGLKHLWAMFDPSGQAAVALEYARRAVSPGGAASDSGAREHYVAVIEPDGCAVTFSPFPLRLTGLRGRITATPARIVIDGVSAEHEAGNLAVEGTVLRAGEAWKAELGILAERMTLAEPLRRAMPWRVRRMWNDLKPAGEFDLRLDRLGLEVLPGRPATWSIAGRGEVRGLSLAAGPGLSGIDGRIEELSAEIGDGLTVSGRLHVDRARIGNWPVTNLSGRLDRPAGRSEVALRDLIGEFCGGRVLGWVELDVSSGPAVMHWDADGGQVVQPRDAALAGPPRYSLSLTARDVLLEDLLNAGRPAGERLRLHGRVDGSLMLTGRLGQPGSVGGSGAALVREAQMLKVPLMLSVLQVIHLAADDNAFHQAAFDFVIDGSEIIVQRIDLQGQALSMLGAGRVRLPAKALRLILLAGSPWRLPRVGAISELLDGVARELMEVHVTGTLEQPEFRAEMVRGVRATVQEILNLTVSAPRRE